MRKKSQGLRKWPTVVRRGLGLILVVVIAYSAMYATNLYGAEESDIPDISQDRAITTYVQDPTVAAEQTTLPIEEATPGWGARLKAWSLSGIDETLEAQATVLDVDRAALEQERNQFEKDRSILAESQDTLGLREVSVDEMLLRFDTCVYQARQWPELTHEEAFNALFEEAPE